MHGPFFRIDRIWEKGEEDDSARDEEQEKAIRSRRDRPVQDRIGLDWTGT